MPEDQNAVTELAASLKPLVQKLTKNLAKLQKSSQDLLITKFSKRQIIIFYEKFLTGNYLTRSFLRVFVSVQNIFKNLSM